MIMMTIQREGQRFSEVVPEFEESGITEQKRWTEQWRQLSFGKMKTIILWRHNYPLNKNKIDNDNDQLHPGTKWPKAAMEEGGMKRHQLTRCNGKFSRKKKINTNRNIKSNLPLWNDQGTTYYASKDPAEHTAAGGGPHEWWVFMIITMMVIDKWSLY